MNEPRALLEIAFWLEAWHESYGFGIFGNNDPLFHGLNDCFYIHLIRHPGHHFPSWEMMGVLRLALRLARSGPRLLRFASRGLVLSVVQALLGPVRWNSLQGLILASPSSAPILSEFNRMRWPLFFIWLYGITTRVFAPAHRRSLSFWQRVIPIYAAYKRTQLQLSLQQADPHVRSKTWDLRHKWAARKVYNLCVELRGFYLKDGTLF